MQNTSLHPRLGGDLLVHVDGTRLAIVQAHDADFRRVLVLRRARDADGLFVERLRAALASLAPHRVLASGFLPERDAHLAAALRRLTARIDLPLVHMPNIRLLARELRHRTVSADDDDHRSRASPPGGTAPPAPAPAVECLADVEAAREPPRYRPPYARPAFAPA